MSIQRIRWGAAVGGALEAGVAQVIAAVLWVTIYSYVLNPGQPMTVYEEHAQASGPWVSIIAGFPIFYLASRWIARGSAQKEDDFLCILTRLKNAQVRPVGFVNSLYYQA